MAVRFIRLLVVPAIGTASAATSAAATTTSAPGRCLPTTIATSPLSPAGRALHDHQFVFLVGAVRGAYVLVAVDDEVVAVVVVRFVVSLEGPLRLVGFAGVVVIVVAGRPAPALPLLALGGLCRTAAAGLGPSLELGRLPGPGPLLLPGVDGPLAVLGDAGVVPAALLSGQPAAASAGGLLRLGLAGHGRLAGREGRELVVH